MGKLQKSSLYFHLCINLVLKLFFKAKSTLYYAQILNRSFCQDFSSKIDEETPMKSTEANWTYSNISYKNHVNI